MKKVIIALVLILSVFIVGGIYIYQSANASYAQAEQETVAFLKERTDLKDVDEFYWYNSEATIFTVKGSNESAEEKYYLVKTDGGTVIMFDAADMVTEQEARRKTNEARSPKRILNAKIGLMEETPIWEVTYKNEHDRLGYYIIDLKTGEWIRSVDNI